MLRAVLDPNTKRIIYKDDGIQGKSLALPMTPNAAPGEISLPEISVGGASPSAPLNSGSLGGGMMRRSYPDFLSQLEKDRGLPQGYLAQTRAVESSNGRNTANPNSSARGDFQFITSTARKYGVDTSDPYSSARGAADLAADNKGYFQNRFGTTPTGADLYGMHQQGAAGYGDLMDGKAPGGAAQSLNGGAGMSASQFLAKLHSVYSNAKPDIPGDPTVQRGPTVAAANAANAPLPGAQGPTFQPGSNTVPAMLAPQVQDQKFNGGIIGLLQGDDYTGAGANKDFTGKMGDLFSSDKFTGAAKGLMGALGGGGQSAPMRAPGIQPMSEADSQNTPNMQLLQMLYRGRGIGQRAAG